MAYDLVQDFVLKTNGKAPEYLNQGTLFNNICILSKLCMLNKLMENNWTVSRTDGRLGITIV